MMKLMVYLIFLFLNLFLFNKKLMMNFMSNFLLMMIFLLNFIFNNKDSWFGIYSWMMLDFYGYFLIFLSIMIISYMFMLNMNFNKIIYSLLLMLLLLFLILSFSSMNLFMFYLFFEMSLIPTFLLIMGWGYQSERLKASMYMFIYTMFSSLPLLLMLFYFLNNNFSLNFLLMLNELIKNYFFMNYLFYFIMMFSFFVKLPMFIFHVWLPKAHVEAPVSGSMILAAVMLKLGGYGIFRLMMMMINYSNIYNYFFILLSLVGMIYVSLMCLRQFDMKMLVAYSSVVHMGIMMMGILSLKNCGIKGGLLMMIGHGLCSSALFLLVNFLYERTKSRLIFMNKGMIYFLPTLSMFWFLFCIINMSAPPSINLMSELMILMNLLNWSMNIIFLLMISLFISSIYSLYLFSYCQHGFYLNNLIKLYPLNLNEFLILLLHYIPLNFLMLKLNYFF